MPRAPILTLLLAALAWAQVAQAPVAAAQVGCTFTQGFKALRDQIPDIVGQCLENERFNQANGNAEQRTVNGLLVWRKADNWTAFTNGHTTWVNGPFGLQARLNSETFPWEAAAAPPAAPPAGPRQTASGRSIPTGYIYSVVEAPREENLLSCLQANPSCNRDPWWVEWNELQSDELVQYSFVGPGLITEFRFIEAIWLLWKWPEGQALLSDAAEHGVAIVADPSADQVIAYYRESVRAIVINPRFAEASTWMVADILAHELRHAADRFSGIEVNSYEACIAAEQAAYQVERRYLVWTVQRFGGIPAPRQVASTLSEDDFDLYANLFSIAAAPDVDLKALEDYRQNCARFQ